MKTQVHGLSSFNQVLVRISQIMAACGAVALGIMMFITVIDVSGRNFFFRPLEGSFELIGILLVIAGSWGMGYCQLKNTNIRINIISDRFPPRGKAILWVVAYAIGVIATGAIAWRVFLRTHEYTLSQLGSVTDTLSIPIWPFTLLMGIGFTWVCFIYLVNLYQSIIEVFKR